MLTCVHGLRPHIFVYLYIHVYIYTHVNTLARHLVKKSNTKLVQDMVDALQRQARLSVALVGSARIVEAPVEHVELPRKVLHRGSKRNLRIVRSLVVVKGRDADERIGGVVAGVGDLGQRGAEGGCLLGGKGRQAKVANLLGKGLKDLCPGSIECLHEGWLAYEKRVKR